MKQIILAALLFVTLGTAAQVKSDSAGKYGVRRPIPDSIIQPSNATPLLSYDDILFLRDSVLQNAPYKFAPVLDQVFTYLQLRVQARAQEFVTKQAAKKP